MKEPVVDEYGYVVATGRKVVVPRKVPTVSSRTLNKLAADLIGLSVTQAKQLLEAHAKVHAQFLDDGAPFSTEFRTNSLRVFVRDDVVTAVERG